MNTIFKKFFNEHMKLEENQESSEDRTRIAAAALMIEVARADFDMDSEELASIEEILRTTLNLNENDLVALIEMAQQESKDSTSLHAFTSLVHQQYSEDEKVILFEHLWRVAYADGRLDKYEEYVLRKIADLIYLSHQHFVQTKLRVLNDM